VKGRLQIYTGDGKGKTTAALGQLIRYLGRGGKACFIQFDKTAADSGELHSERRILTGLKNLDFQPTGLARFDPVKKEFRFENTQGDLDEVARGLHAARQAFDGEYGLIILDEVLSLPLTKMASREQIMELIGQWEKAGQQAELILTGHISWPPLVERADLVTQMRKIKHYYDAGQDARQGIDY
jgi:cob(I)alamin adenosyltransferase